MPSTVYTYLQQQCDVPEPGRKLDGEVRMALTRLPQETPVFLYEGMSKLEVTARIIRNGGGCCGFLNMPEKALDGKHERLSFRKIYITPIPGFS